MSNDRLVRKKTRNNPFREIKKEEFKVSMNLDDWDEEEEEEVEDELEDELEEEEEEYIEEEPQDMFIKSSPGPEEPDKSLIAQVTEEGNEPSTSQSTTSSTAPASTSSTPKTQRKKTNEFVNMTPDSVGQSSTDIAATSASTTITAKSTKKRARANPNTDANSSTVTAEDGENEKKRENHRLVERKRREIINNGINDLAKVIPNCPKKRSEVILNAIQHIEGLENTNKQAKAERDLLKEQNQALLKELAEKNKKISKLLLLI